ncbi:MAG: HEAT repeat domain-containing protein [Myxococcota bacterium]
MTVARTLASLGQLTDAQSVLVAGLRLARGQPEALEGMVRELGTLAERTRHATAALSCAWFAPELERMRALDADAAPSDQARSWMLRGQRAGSEAVRCFERAAALFSSDAKWAHTAEAWERAGAMNHAAAAWERVARAAWRAPRWQALARVKQRHAVQGSPPEEIAPQSLIVASRELRAWENGWDIADHTADWLTCERTEVSPALSLELRLLALETDGKPSGAVVYALSRLAHGLGDVGEPALMPLGVLSRRRAPAVRRAVVRALGRIPRAAALRALIRALDDPDAAVVDEARKSIAALRGPDVLGGLLTLAGTGSYAGRMRRAPLSDATRRAVFTALSAMEEAQPYVASILQTGGQADRRMMREVMASSAATAHPSSL